MLYITAHLGQHLQWLLLEGYIRLHLLLMEEFPQQTCKISNLQNLPDGMQTDFIWLSQFFRRISSISPPICFMSSSICFTFPRVFMGYVSFSRVYIYILYIYIIYLWSAYMVLTILQKYSAKNTKSWNLKGSERKGNKTSPTNQSSSSMLVLEGFHGDLHVIPVKNNEKHFYRRCGTQRRHWKKRSLHKSDSKSHQPNKNPTDPPSIGRSPNLYCQHLTQYVRQHVSPPPKKKSLMNPEDPHKLNEPRRS